MRAAVAVDAGRSVWYDRAATDQAELNSAADGKIASRYQSSRPSGPPAPAVLDALFAGLSRLGWECPEE